MTTPRRAPQSGTAPSLSRPSCGTTHAIDSERVQRDWLTGLLWLSAQVVVSNDKPQAYGRRTQVWLGYGVHLGELNPAEAREALAEMRGFVNRLEHVVKQAEDIGRATSRATPDRDSTRRICNPGDPSLPQHAAAKKPRPWAGDATAGPRPGPSP